MRREEAVYKVLIEAAEVLTKCGDFVLIGGWVPEVLYPNKQHVGSLDVDLFLQPESIQSGIDLHQHLCRHHFHRSERDTPTQYVRQVPDIQLEVAVDLLTTPQYLGKRVRSLEIGGLKIESLPGLDLAHNHHDLVEIDVDRSGEHSRTLSIKVVRPEAFILIKSFPLDRRNKAKDAYDIAFVLQHHKSLNELAARMAPITETTTGEEAYTLLRHHFETLESNGPNQAAAFAKSAGLDSDQARQAAFLNAKELFTQVAICRGEF